MSYNLFISLIYLWK